MRREAERGYQGSSSCPYASVSTSDDPADTEASGSVVRVTDSYWPMLHTYAPVFGLEFVSARPGRDELKPKNGQDQTVRASVAVSHSHHRPKARWSQEPTWGLLTPQNLCFIPRYAALRSE